MAPLGRFLDANRLAVVGIVAMVAVVAVAARLALQSTSSSTIVSSTAHTSPTPDPRIARFKQLSVDFINAFDQSDRTGDASVTDQYTVPGSQARGNAGLGAAITVQSHKALVVDRLDVDQSTWAVQLGVDTEVTFSYSLYGHQATWPNLTPLEKDHESGPFTTHLTFEQLNGQWLIFTYN